MYTLNSDHLHSQFQLCPLRPSTAFKASYLVTSFRHTAVYSYIEGRIMHIKSLSAITLQSYTGIYVTRKAWICVRDCSAQTLDPWFVVQSMDWPRNPRIARAQSID